MRPISLLFAIFTVTILIWAGVKVKHWLAVDACLDAGGAFDYSQHQCER